MPCNKGASFGDEIQAYGFSGASGKNLVLLQASCSAPDRITWRGIDTKKSEANLADAPFSLVVLLVTHPGGIKGEGSVLEVERTAQAEHLAYVKTRACGLHSVTCLHISNTTQSCMGGTCFL